LQSLGQLAPEVSAPKLKSPISFSGNLTATNYLAPDGSATTGADSSRKLKGPVSRNLRCNAKKWSCWPCAPRCGGWIEILREIHRYRFAKRGRLFGSDVELMIVYGAAMSYYGFRKPVRALPISRYLEMPRETVLRHMGRLVALGLFERAEDQTFVPTKELRGVEIDWALRLLRQGTAGLL
jgi:hypothetical protein